LNASSKRLCLQEGLEVACCADEAVALAFGELAATSPDTGGLDDDKTCVDDEPGDCSAVEDGDKPRLPEVEATKSFFQAKLCR
jgi:hypothetical protein